ncbi:MAG: site-specific integrase [Parafilimonas sp.]|nr:site-specific integrase [Parafilimonas sp.]
MLIPEPKFYLKDVRSEQPTLIYLQVKYTHEGQQRLMLSVGDKVHPNEWDYAKHRAIVTKKTQYNADVNLWLEKVCGTYRAVFRNFIIDGIIPTAAMIKEKMEVVLNLNSYIPVKKEIRVTFFSFIQKFIEESESFKATNTRKSYTSTYNRLKEYASFCNKEFSFEDINLEWRAGFIKFLQTLGAAKNTEGKHIKNIKVFLNEATERGINKSLAFKSKSFSKPTEEVFKIFLTQDEITKIANLDLSDDHKKDITRDYFIIACLTSLRYSDFIRIRPEHIKGEYLQMITAKTNQEIVIPISPIVRSIFEKYNFRMPKAEVNQIFNKYLKEIGKQAELNENVHVTKTVAGVKRTFIKPKWQYLSSHVGKRSLISNCILEGINTNSIMMISGHKSLKVFQSYNKLSQQQNAQALSNNAFFKN